MTSEQKPTVLIGILLALVIVGVIALAGLLLPSCRSPKPPVPPPPPVTATQQTTSTPAGKYYFAGMPRSISTHSIRVLTNIAYVIGYDETRHDPVWTCFRLFKVDSFQAPERPRKFSVDTRTRSRVTSSDYTSSGYDRGHMAPNFAIAVCYGEDAQQETFLMSNVIPQRPKLNEQVWERLERKEIREYAQQYEEIWVITGPVFDLQPATIKDGVQVPKACYRIIIDEEQGQLRVLAFIIPQTVNGSEDPGAYMTSVDEIEKQTGLDFMSELPDAVENKLEAVMSRMW